MRALLATLCLAFLSSCAGYQWGGNKPTHLGNVETIHVPLAKTRVIFPRVEPLTTSSVVDALVNDGTYTIGTPNKTDAALYLTVDSIEYRQTRSSRDDVLRSEELELEISISFKLIDSMNPGTPLEAGRVRGETRFFVGGNQQTARANALHDAIRRASIDLVSQLSDGL
ncbi:MAG: LPS assembly lipoprotein LptE [Akkermansiaceae bacterium]